MNNDNAPHQDRMSQPPLDQDAVQSLLDELDSLPDDDVETDDECEADDYPRYVVVDLPDDAAAEFGVGLIYLPIRQILEWYAAECPDEARLMLGLRDEFYSGDHEDDYYLTTEPPTFYISEEQRAVNRVARAAKKPDRDRRRLEFERRHEEEASESRAHADASRTMWLPFAEEQRALDDAEAELMTRWATLPGEWDRFIMERDTWGDERSVLEAAERTRLESFYNALVEELLSIRQRGFALADRVRQAAEAKAA